MTAPHNIVLSRAGFTKFSSTNYYALPTPSAARQFATDYFMPAKYSLNSDSIITPRPDNETHSMSYVRNAHIGMQYELKINIFGGAYPHYFDVLAAPAGTTLGETVFDANYGVIKWTPSTTGTYTFNIRVTDQDGAIQTRTWTVTVGADAFRFVSPAGSNAAAGTIAAPWQTLAYALDNTTGGRTVVLRAGTYTEVMSGKTVNNSLANGVIGYNGETVTISGANMTYSGQHGVFMVNSPDFTLFNLRLVNPNASMNDPRWSSSFTANHRSIMDKCYVDIANTVGVQNFDNISVMFMGDAGTTRKYCSQTRNTFTGWRGSSNGWSSFDTYDTQFFVHEENTYNIQNNSAQVGVLWAKGVGTRYMTIRRNEFLNPWSGIISDIYLANSGVDYVTGDIEICYNKLWGVATQDTANLALAIGRSSQSGIRSPVYSYRNTIKGNFAIYFRSFAVTVSSEQDVVVTDALANGVTTHRILGRDTTGADWTWPNPATRGSITLGITGTECHGNTSAGIIDASLNLTGASATSWTGKRGAQVSVGVALPSAVADWESYLAGVLTYPRPDNETAVNARHRVNYTGQKYRVPVAVHGGAWPFLYELTAAPAGMTIGSSLTLVDGELVAGADYGVITWDNPTAGTHTVSVRVLQQDAAAVTVSYQLVVGTEDWVFFDPTAVTNGTGTIGSPFNTLASLTGLTTKSVLFRAGTVDWQQKTVGLNNMPKTFLPYANEVVTMLQADSPIGTNLGGDFFFGGFTFKIPSTKTATNQFFRLDGATRTVFFDNLFDLESYGNTNGSPENSSVLMWTNQNVAANSSSNANYCVIKNNRFKNVSARDTYLGYQMRYTVVEGNSMENCSATGGGHGFYPKTNVEHFTFRGNYSIGTQNTQKLLRIDAYNSNFLMDYYDVSYNSYRYYGTSGEGAIALAHEFVTCGSNRYIYRNTLYSNHWSTTGLYYRGMASGDLVTSSNNVLISDGTQTNGIRFDQFQGSATNTGYLIAGSGGGLVDANNKLLGGNTSYLGRKGAQIASGGMKTITSASLFGAKNGMSYYENFETQPVGAVIGNIGDLKVSTITGSSISSSTTHSGTRSYRHDFEVGDFPKVYKDLAGTARRIKLSCWLRFEGTTRASGVWKLSRAGRGTPYSGSPNVKSSYTSSTGASIPAAFSGEINDADDVISGWSAQNTGVAASSAFTSGSWMYYECLVDWGTVNGNDCKFIERINGQPVVSIVDRNILTTGNPTAYANWFMTPICGLDGAPTAQVVYHMDELLIEEDWAGVVLTNSATYSTATKWSAQPVVSWNSSEIVYTRKRGGFSVGETAYEHVLDSTGSVIYSSSSFLITEDGP